MEYKENTGFLMRTAFALIVFLPSSQGFSSNISNQVAYSVAQVDMSSFYSPRPVESSFNIELETGSSDNPVLLPEGDAIDSSYYQLKPQWQLTYPMSETLWLLTAVEGNLKDYVDNVVSDNKREFSGQIDLGLTHFITPSHEWGIVASGVLNQSRSLDFSVDGINSKGRGVEYLQSYGEIYYSFNQPGYNLQLSSNIINKNNDTLTQDEVLLNGRYAEFNDDYEQLDFKAKLSLKIREDLDLSFEPFHSRRNYQERSARFTEGGTNQGGNPVLEELHRGVRTGFEYDDEFVEYEVKAQFTNEKDLVFRAQNATSYGLEAKAKFPIASLFAVSGEFTWLNRNYDFFVVNPQDAPTSRDLRRDIEKNYKLGLEKSFLGQEFNLFYKQIEKNSNYRPSGSALGSLYSEKQIALSVNFNL